MSRRKVDRFAGIRIRLIAVELMHSLDFVVLRCISKSERQARRIHQEIRKLDNKESSPLLTIEEFCEYYRIRPDEIQKHLK